MTIKEFLDFFGLSTLPNAALFEPKTHGGRILQGLAGRGQTHLELHFQDPLKASEFEESDAWDSFIKYHRPAFKFDRPASPKTPCEDTIVDWIVMMVDWIMTVAFPYIKDIPHVWLSGAVKAASRDKWTRILTVTRGLPLGQDYGCGFDYHSELRAIVGQPFIE